MSKTTFHPQRRWLGLLGALLASALHAPAHASAVDDIAKQHWIQVESANFRIVTDQPEDLARQMVTDLENLRYISNRVRGAESLPGEPLTLLAMSRSDFYKLDVSNDIAGAFLLSKKGYVAIADVDDYAKLTQWNSPAREVLLHEYHHFLLHYAPETNAYPFWVDEGMSEYWSTMTTRDGKVWFGRRDVDGDAREEDLIDASNTIRFDTRELFNYHRVSEDDSRPGRKLTYSLYARARFAMHYFMSSPELRQQLAHYVRVYNQGLSQDQAARIAFKKSYAELDKDMRNYVEHHLTARGFDIGKGGLDLPQVTPKVSQLDRAGIYAVLADTVPRFGWTKSDAVNELIATNAALHPDDPQAAMLAAERLAPNESGPRLLELTRKYPKHAGLLARRADWLRVNANRRRATGASDWMTAVLEARALFRRAIAADPENAYAYVGLGCLYGELPDSEPLEEGIVGLETGIIFERDPAMFHALADLYLRRKQLPQALKSLRSEIAFGGASSYPFDVLRMQNLTLLMDLPNGTPTATGLRFRSGAIYEGPLRDGKPEGKGKWLYPDGSFYEGDFAGGLPSGHGKLENERGYVYDGEFTAGYARGKGHYAFPPASKLVSYDGDVDGAGPAGAGVLVTKKGRLEASFVQGEAHGSGRFTPAASAQPIAGTWRFGDFDWPEADKVLFTGGIDAQGRRHGYGWCRDAGTDAPVTRCQYQGGKRVALETKSDDD